MIIWRPSKQMSPEMNCWVPPTWRHLFPFHRTWFCVFGNLFFTRVPWSSKIGNNLCLSGFDWMTCNSSTVRVPFLLGFSTFGWWLLSECLKQLSCCHMISWSCVLWKWLLHAAQFTFLFILCAIFSLICIVIVLKDSPY